jgi:hypothetical protein
MISYFDAICLTLQELGVELDEVKFKQNLQENLHKYKVSHPKAYTLEFLQQFEKNAELKLSGVGTKDAPSFYKPKIFDQSEYIVKNRLGASDPLLPVSRKEQKWNAKKEMTELDLQLQKIKSDYNKLNIENEEKISTRICENFTKECICTDFMVFFFGEGCLNQKYREMYARLCQKLDKQYPDIFKKALICQCQKEFEIRANEDMDDEEIIGIMKKRMSVGYFIIELYKVKIITTPIIIMCLTWLLNCSKAIQANDYKLMNYTERPHDYDVCHTIDMLLGVIPLISNVKVLNKYNCFCLILQKYYTDKLLGCRNVFKVEELLKLTKQKKML